MTSKQFHLGSTFWSKKTLNNEGYIIDLYPNNVPPYQLFIEDAGTGSIIPIGYKFFDLMGFSSTYKGSYTPLTTYNMFDIIYYVPTGELFMSSINNNTSQNPPTFNSSIWFLIEPGYTVHEAEGNTLTTYTDVIYDVQLEKTYDEKNLVLGFPIIDNVSFKINYIEFFNIIQSFENVGATGSIFISTFYSLVILNCLINPTINLNLKLPNYDGLDLSIDYPTNLTGNSLIAWKHVHSIKHKYLASFISVRETNSDKNLNVSVLSNRYEINLDIFNDEKVLDIETENLTTYLLKMLNFDQLEFKKTTEVENPLKLKGDIKLYNNVFKGLDSNNVDVIVEWRDIRNYDNTYMYRTYQLYEQIWRKFYTLFYKYFFQFNSTGGYNTNETIAIYLTNFFTEDASILTPYQYHKYFVPYYLHHYAETSEVYPKANYDRSTKFYDLYFPITYTPKSYSYGGITIQYNDWSKSEFASYSTIFSFLDQEYKNNICIFRSSWTPFVDFDGLPSLNFKFIPIWNTSDTSSTKSDYTNKLLNIDDLSIPKFTYRSNVKSEVNHSQIGSTSSDSPTFQKIKATDKTSETIGIFSLKNSTFNSTATINDLEVGFSTIGAKTHIEIINKNSKSLCLYYNYGTLEFATKDSYNFTKIHENVILYALNDNYWQQYNPEFYDTITGEYGFKIKDEVYQAYKFFDIEFISKNIASEDKLKEHFISKIQELQGTSLANTQASLLLENFNNPKNSSLEGEIILEPYSLDNIGTMYKAYDTGKQGKFVKGDYTTEEIPERIQQFLKLQKNYVIFLSCKMDLEKSTTNNKYLILN